jgi:hypothetical protein
VALGPKSLGREKGQIMPELNDTSPAVEEMQIQMLRKATIAQRFSRESSLSSTVIHLSRRAIGRNHPSYSDREIKLEFIALHYGKDLSEKVKEFLTEKNLT